MFKRLYVQVVFKLFPAYRLRKSGAVVGKNVFFGDGFYAELENAKLLKIGEGTVFAAFCKIILHDSSLNNIDDFGILYGKVNIGRHVYIGAGSIILPGTDIGDGTIVGAGSVVKGVLKKNSVYVGTPAKYLESVKELKEKWKKRKNKLIFFKESRRWYEQTK